MTLTPFSGFQLIIRRRGEVLSGECEMSYVHHLLSRVPEDLPDYIDELVTAAHELFRKFPPEKLVGAVERYLKERSVCEFFVVVVGL